MNSNNSHIKTQKLPLSILIITYNEERNIESVLKNLDFADEILVVDSFSTDRTVELAQKFENIILKKHAFENYAAQRNFSISLARNSWILFLDADERITPELKQEIIATLQKKDTFSAYFIYRTFMFKNTKLRFSGWQTDKMLKLFKKEEAQYDLNKKVHERLIVSGKIGKLKNKLIHYSYNDYESYQKKMISYGKLKASEEFSKGLNPIFFHYYIRPLYQFMYQYIFRLGVLDGKKGIVICYLNALSVFVRFQELKKIYFKN